MAGGENWTTLHSALRNSRQSPKIVQLHPPQGRADRLIIFNTSDSSENNSICGYSNIVFLLFDTFSSSTFNPRSTRNCNFKFFFDDRSSEVRGIVFAHLPRKSGDLLLLGPDANVFIDAHVSINKSSKSSASVGEIRCR